jgi:hypothetical protein
MASLYRRPRSPFWYLKFLEDGTWQQISTGLRYDSPTQTRKAQALCAKATFREKSSQPVRAGGAGGGWDWVPSYLRLTRRTPRTLEAYELRWRHVARFLTAHRIDHPRQLRHEDAQRYLEWRTAQNRPAGKPIAFNTAVAEAKTLKTLLEEATARQLIEANPFAKAHFTHEASDEKPEITEAERSRIEAALLQEPLWMRRAWAIAMSTGCRLRETRIQLRHVDLDRGTILFPAPKGGARRAYTIPLPASLRPLFEQMQKSGENVTLDFPFQPSRQWRLFFDRLRMGHLCFHCTRVTFITKLARANVPLAVAMRLVNHASRTIHRIYQRLNLDDLQHWTARLAHLDPSFSAPSPSAPSAPAPAAKPRTARGKSNAPSSGNRATKKSSARRRS